MFSFDNLDDPKKQMLLAMAAGLLSPVRSKGMSGFGEAMGQGINAGLMGYNAASQNKRRNELSDIQKKMSQMQLGEMENNNQFRSAVNSGYQPGGPIPYNDSLGSEPQQGPVGQRPEAWDLSAASKVDAMKAAQFRQGLNKTEAPIVSKPGDVARDKTGKIIWENPATPEKTPDWKDPEYQAFMMRKAAAGKTSVSIENKMGNSMASKLGEGTAGILDAGRSKAESAKDSITQGHQILGALDSGGTYTGPAASVRLRAAQVAQLLGMNPDADGINRTRAVITGLANQTLNARGLLKGQGQVTEYEQKTLEKAKSGNIDDMSAEEIRTVVKVNERAARAQIAAHGKLVGVLGKRPEYAEALPFYQIDEPPAYAAPQRLPTPDEIAAEFQRRMRK